MTVKRKMIYKSLHIFSLKSYYRRLVFGARKIFIKRGRWVDNYCEGVEAN